jgi:hypothetical protein
MGWRNFHGRVKQWAARSMNVLVGFAIVFAVHPAQADWENTKWEMTVDQVAAAAPDIISTDSDGQRSPHSTGIAMALLKTFYNFSGVPTTAYFLFDNESRRLRFVTLEPTTSGQLEVIAAALERKYGKPIWSDDPEGIMWAQIWESAGDRIELLKIVDKVQIRFSPATCRDAQYAGCEEATKTK